MCKRWPGCPDEIRRSRIGSFCTSNTDTKQYSTKTAATEEKKMKLKTPHEETMGKKKQSSLAHCICKRARPQKEHKR
ncbi:hypothetical protein PAHAL_5G190100 [Panicum hallii]|uniref:Uncharacterized protein n=1 Tax=Panicum hallii TaxID=206008 RepID=A0A2S3HSQ7_9POAL|nr:hypothetical protein PAHAL_5G190100 [Panicum hallii]